MPRKLPLFLLLAIIFTCTLSATDHKNRKAEFPRKELSMLNKAIKASPLYNREKSQHLDSISEAFKALPESQVVQRWQTAQTLAKEYLPVRADSSLRYAEVAYLIATDHDLPSKALESRIARINALTTAGIFTRAVYEFHSIEVSGLPDALRRDYFAAGRKLYGYMRTYVEGDQQFFTEYSEKYIQYDDSLVNILPADSPEYKFLTCERLIANGRYREAKPTLEALLSSLPEEENLYGMTAFQIAIVYLNQGDQTQYAAYLAKAAISDIKGCIKDGLALPTLADWLYEHGELSDAFRYINFALEDAMEGNVRMRTVTIAALLPLIDEAYQEKINASRDELMIYFMLVTFLLIISGVLVTILYRQIKRSRANAHKLANTAKLQENYIGNFIGLCSSYANRLQNLQNLVTRKIASGQAEELLKIINSGKFSTDQDEEFYKIFDSAFLDIVPDFIKGINALLRPEERIEIPEEKILTTELRIYAFVRLGVEESTRIAQILNYSVSTVYSYRNRMRNKAIDRDNFDTNVTKIGTID